MAEGGDDDLSALEEALQTLLRLPPQGTAVRSDSLTDYDALALVKAEVERSSASEVIWEDPNVPALPPAGGKLTGKRRRSSRVRHPRGPASLDYWASLPGILLEDIFLYLDWPTRLRAAKVCSNWYYNFLSPRLWRHLKMAPGMFNYYRLHPIKGHTLDISTSHVQKCLGRIGHHLCSIEVKPFSNFNHLYEIIHILGTYLGFFDEYPSPMLESFRLTFACELRGQTGSILLGTGGQILEEIKMLLGNLRDIRNVAVNQLRLDNQDSGKLLDGVLKRCAESLEVLEVLNCTKERCPLYHAAMFPALQKLIITPPQINDDMVLMLARHRAFRELVLVQDQYTPAVEPISTGIWLEVRQTRPDFKVRLEARGRLENDLMVQERAPVHSVVYNTPYVPVSAEHILHCADEYAKSLQIYGHKLLPRLHGSRSFQERADTSLVLLIRECPNIRSLIVRDRVSTATVLILASEGKNLQHLYVRRNAVLKRCDWPKASHWSDDHYAWLRSCSRSYDKVEQEVSRLLGDSWHLMSDRAFVALKI